MYKWNPSDYEKNSSPQERAAEAILSRLEFEGDEHILDIGCGDGKITAKIDNSQEMIDFARKRFPSTQHANLSFERRDAQSLEYDQKFDLVTSFACLHWVKDHLAVLRGIKRGLKPGGRMIIQCGGRGTNDDIFALTRKIMKSDRWSDYFHKYSNPHGIYGPEEYHAWLNQVGLEELKVNLTIKDLILPGRAELDGFIRTTWLSVTEHIPEEMRSQFIAEISNSYLECRPLEDGLAMVGMGVLEVEARRPD
jgi:trans-aconitate 2-methyltransferase